MSQANTSQELPLKSTMRFEYGQSRELRPGIRRIVANNPSPFTFKGTNTYLVGTGSELVVIDPGPDDAAHLRAILQAAGTARIGTILLTHTHRDHYDGVPALQAATGAKTAGFGRIFKRSALLAEAASSEEPQADFKPDIVLGDDAVLAWDGQALEALHTPGHAPDHLCFALTGTKLLFSGDHVMSWNTSVVAPPEGSMGAYLRSLERLVPRDDEVFLPGHGGTLRSPQKTVRAFIIHRKMREQAILDAIRKGQTTIPLVVDVVYRGLDPRLVKAARASVLAHVERLVEMGLVACEGPPTLDRALAAVST